MRNSLSTFEAERSGTAGNLRWLSFLFAVTLFSNQTRGMATTVAKQQVRMCVSEREEGAQVKVVLCRVKMHCIQVMVTREKAQFDSVEKRSVRR